LKAAGRLRVNVRTPALLSINSNSVDRVALFRSWPDVASMPAVLPASEVRSGSVPDVIIRTPGGVSA